MTNGTLRLSSSGALATGNLNLSGGAVVEAGFADFTRTLGTGAGQVQFTGSGGFSASGLERNVNLGGGGTVIWNSGNFVPTGSALVLSSNYSDRKVTFQNDINLNSGLRTILVNDGAAAVDAELTGILKDTGSGGGVMKTGAGTLLLSTHATYTGTTQISGGVLRASATDVFAATTSFVLDDVAGASFDLNGFNQAIGSLAGGGSTGGGISLAGAVLTVGGNNSSTVYDGRVTGAGGLSKTGTGNFSLSAAQNYTGSTSVNGGGKLFVNGSLAAGSPVAVGGTGTLGGSGTVNALVTVAVGGSIQAGDVGNNGSLALRRSYLQRPRQH